MLLLLWLARWRCVSVNSLPPGPRLHTYAPTSHTHTPPPPPLSFLSGGVQDFFANLRHIQLHRTVRALQDLSARLSETATTTGAAATSSSSAAAAAASLTLSAGAPAVDQLPPPPPPRPSPAFAFHVTDHTIQAVLLPLAQHFVFESTDQKTSLLKEKVCDLWRWCLFFSRRP
jgi:hypothetical protein